MDMHKHCLDDQVGSRPKIQMVCLSRTFLHALILIQAVRIVILSVKQTTNACNSAPGQSGWSDLSKHYLCHPTLRLLDKTSLYPLVLDKRKGIVYPGSSASISDIIMIRSSTWFGCGSNAAWFKFRISDPSQVESIVNTKNVPHRQEETLDSEQVITFAQA